MSSTQTRVSQRGTVLMFDMEGGEYRVKLFKKEARLNRLTDGLTPREDATHWLQWGEEELQQQPDGSFQIPSSGTLIYPRSRHPTLSAGQEPG